jgi:1-deoxy-D-xylulose-5-phosphate synthase
MAAILASNLGVVELTVALYRNFDFPKDKLIFDVGHQCYTHKILSGRSLDHLRCANGVSGFERRNESVYDCYEAGHSGTSLSAAEGFAIARDLHKENYDIVDVIGDSSIVNGLSFEALNNLGSRKNKVIIILNDNDMSISRPVGGLGNFFRKISTDKLYNKAKKAYQRAMWRGPLGRRIYNFNYNLKNDIKAALVPTTMFDNMGFTYIGPIDGHDLKALDKALAGQKPRPNRSSSTFTRSKEKAINPPRTISPAIGMASPRLRLRRAMPRFSILRS